MDIKVKIANRIKELRVERGLTQEALAYKSELDRTFMNHAENGRRNLSVKSLEKIVVNGLESSFKNFFNSNIFEQT